VQSLVKEVAVAKLPVGSLVLAVLRTIADLKQKDVETAAAAASGLVGYYERRKEPPPEALSDFVSGMDYPSYMIGRTRDFVEEALAARGPNESQDPEELARLELEERAYAEFRDLVGRLDAFAEAFLEHREAPYLWRRLVRHTAEERLALVKIDRDFQSPGLCVLVCEKSEEAAADDGRRAEELARLAIEIARRVPGSAGRRARLEGIADLFLGNALRVRGQLPAAEEAFTRSALLWSQGAGTCQGLLDPSRPLDLKASLRLAQRRLPESLKLLEGALLLARTSRARGRILLKKAKAHEEMGDHEEALGVLREAESHVVRAGDPHQLFALSINRLVNLLELGRAGEAASGFMAVKDQAARLQSAFHLLRCRWLEGRIAAAFGQTEEAVAAFRQVGEAFTRREVAYDSALVHLELAKLLLEAGRAAEVRALTAQLEPIFVSQGVHREALAAVRLFVDAARKEQATAELAQSVFDFLRRSRHNSEVHFEMKGSAPSPEELGKQTGEGTGK
jgi:tetratricopeptide (TPR) repeat protein